MPLNRGAHSLLRNKPLLHTTGTETSLPSRAPAGAAEADAAATSDAGSQAGEEAETPAEVGASSPVDGSSQPGMRLSRAAEAYSIV